MWGNAAAAGISPGCTGNGQGKVKAVCRQDAMLTFLAAKPGDRDVVYRSMAYIVNLKPFVLPSP